MALEIKNLQEKLNGELPINRLELLVLVNSWERTSSFYINENIQILECEAKECYDLSKLDTSEITDMSNVFTLSKFNGDISNWDVSNVTNMRGMFAYAKDFNQALNGWDVSSVTNMSFMFQDAESFNQPINNWDVSKVTNMYAMFSHAIAFNQALNNWNVSNVTNMGAMFFLAKEFNQALNSWDVSNVTNMNDMFSKTFEFNQALNSWDVSNVKNMNFMFGYASNFNQPLNWNVSSVTDMGEMFYRAIAFEKRFNNGKPLPENTNELEQWLKENSDKKLAIKTLNEESSPEQKIAIIENKISNNKTTLDELFKEKNIEPNSKIGLELLKVYNDTHDKLKLDLEELKTQVVDIATNDFNSI